MPRIMAVPNSAAGLPTLALDCSPISGDPDATCVRPAGDLDIATAPQLESTLRAAVLSAGLVVLDMGDLTSIDGSGVHAIDDARARARLLGRRLVVLRGPAHVTRPFDMSGISPDLELSRADPPEPVAPRARRDRSLLIQGVANHA